MAEVVAGVGYTIETLAEGALALAKGIYTPTAPLNATFKKIPAPSIPRSSHTLSVIRGNAYIFGGEISPRQPVDNNVEKITLPHADLQEADHATIPAKPARPGDDVPAPRVGHSAAVIDSRVYVFGGRGGKAMAALEEKGRVWVFDTTTHTWSYLDPKPSSPYPEARSYHSSAASRFPLPPHAQPSKAKTNALLNALPPPNASLPEPPDPTTYGTLFIHAGCLSTGGRASDLWSFDLSSRSWSLFPAAPAPARGGTSLALTTHNPAHGHRLYRFGGFDGQAELGGALDHLDVLRSTTAALADAGPDVEMALAPSGAWATSPLPTPPPRSVAALAPVTTGQGRNYLLLLCGERDPSASGHDAAGRFLDDAWSYQLRPEGMTAAAVKDAVRSELLGKGTGEAEAVECKCWVDEGEAAGPRLVQEGQPRPWGRRGWLACDAAPDVGGGGSVVFWGGVGEDNERLGDGWIVTVE